MIGQVIGTTTLRGFRFVIKEGLEEKVKRDEFVSVKESVTNEDVIGVIKEITISNELLPDEFGRDLRLADIILNEGEYPVPTVKILGVKGDDGLELPRHGIKPGSEVELVSDDTINDILSQDPSKAAYVGSLITRDTVPVHVSINELISKHCAVLAMTGAGKSYTAGVLIEELMKKKGSIVAFDPHGEYRDIEFSDSNVRVFSVEGKDQVKVNVSDLSTGDFGTLIPDLTVTQRDLLDEVLNLASRFYDKYDLHIILDLLSTLYDIKKGDRTKKKKKEADEVEEEVGKSLDFPAKALAGITRKVGLPTIGSLMRRIKRLERMGLFDMQGIPLNEVVSRNQLTVVNLSEADERVSEIIVATLCRAIFDARKSFVRERDGNGLKLDTPVFIVVEEAHNFVPRGTGEEATPSRRVLRKIAREGRKFGVGLCLVSQRPGKLDADVLSQCNTQVIMKIVNPSDQEYIRQSVESVTEDIVRDLPGLGRGEAIISGSAIKLPVTVKIRERTTKVSGGDIDVVGEWMKN